MRCAPTNQRLEKRNPGRQQDHARQTHRSLIGPPPPQLARIVQSLLSPQNQWRSTQLNVLHVAHMDRVEVTTPHPADRGCVPVLEQQQQLV